MLVIGFLTSMRTEQNAARNSTYVIIARQMAHTAVDNALFLMRTNMPVINAQTYYATQPGGAATTISTPTDLFYPVIIGNGTNNLNADSAIIGYTNMPVNAAWVNVCTNGSDGTTPGILLLGRFTYWVDDEGTKININTANKRSANIAAPLPGDVDLTVLPLNNGTIAATSVASNSWSYGQTNGYFTIEQWQAAAGITPTIFSNCVYNLTAYGTDDNLTPWGAARLNLNDQTIANCTNFAQRVAAVNTISNYLDNSGLTNWFGPGRTFADKYGNVAQIAANFIDWIDTDKIPTDSSADWTDTTPPAYLGLEVTPYLNELRITNTLVIADIGGGQFEYKFTTQTDVELWNPYNSAYNTGANQLQVLLLNRPAFQVLSTGVQLFNYQLPNPSTITTGSGVAPSTTINANSYSVLTFSETFVVTNNTVGDQLIASNNTVTAIYRYPLGRIDYAQVPLPASTNTLVAPPVNGTNTFGNRQISACNDPRVKPVSNNWTPLIATDPGTFGSANSALNYSAGGVNGSYQIPGDGDSSCHVVADVTRDKGYVAAIGELAYIHTGWPWRTLCLQPQPAAETNPIPRLIPDWIVLDLFSTTNAPVIGRININAGITNLATLSPRVLPLRSLFTAALGVTALDPSTNIYNCVFNPNLFMHSPPTYFLPGIINFVGQVCEVSGFTPSAATKELNERRIRSVADLLTVRSDTFTITALGQAVDVNTNVMAEAKVQAVVQRYVDGTVAPPAVKFRTLYFRYLTP